MEEKKVKQEAAKPQEAKKQDAKKQETKKFVNPVLAWTVLALELTLAIVLGVIICTI